MLFQAIDQKIRDAFSDAAMHYDMLTSLHKEIGRELTGKIMNGPLGVAILDIGMGTGWYTNRLTGLVSEGIVVGLDIAAGMVDIANKQDRSFQIVQGDAACLPFQPESFDLLTSNLAYQWMPDLPRAFTSCYNVLKKEGRLCLTMFGHDTFHELFTALQHCSRDKELSIGRLPTIEQVRQSLNIAGFQGIQVTTELVKVRFEDMMGLVRWVKGIGANAIAKDFYVGKELLRKTDEYYNARFCDRLGVYATFEVIWAEGWK